MSCIFLLILCTKPLRVVFQSVKKQANKKRDSTQVWLMFVPELLSISVQTSPKLVKSLITITLVTCSSRPLIHPHSVPKLTNDLPLDVKVLFETLSSCLLDSPPSQSNFCDCVCRDSVNVFSHQPPAAFTPSAAALELQGILSYFLSSYWPTHHWLPNSIPRQHTTRNIVINLKILNWHSLF